MGGLTTEMQEVIRKNLPAQVGEVLKKELQALVSVRETLRIKEESLENFKKEIEKLSRFQDVENAQKSKQAELNQKERELTDKEIKLEISMLKKELEMTQISRVEIKDLVASLFRNLEFRKAVYGTQPFQSADGYVSQGQKDHTEDTKIE